MRQELRGVRGKHRSAPRGKAGCVLGALSPSRRVPIPVHLLHDGQTISAVRDTVQAFGFLLARM